MKALLLPFRKSLLLPFRKSFSQIWWIFLKENSAFLGSTIPPLSIGIVAFLCGMVSVIPYKEEFNQEELVRTLFHMFYVIVLVTGVFLSMSTFVNERRQGTLELLYTLPISETQLVLGKFLMGVFLMTSIALSIALFYVLWIAQAPWYMAFTGSVGLILAGCYAYSIGIFASSFTDSHLLSLLISALIIGIIDVGGFLAGLLPTPIKEIITHLHGLNQFFAFTKGILTLRGFVFFSSFTLLFLFLSVKVLESRRWKGTKI